MPAAFLIQVAIKASVVLTATWVATRTMRQHSAAARHLVWTLGVVAILLLPVLGATGPTWDVAVPSAHVVAPAFEQVAATPASTLAPPFDRAIAGVAFRSPDEPPASDRESNASFVRPVVLVGIWLCGSLIALLQLVVGVARVRWVVSRAIAPGDPAWRTDVAAAAAALRLTATVSLRMTNRTAVPLVCGLWRAVILLPIDAEHWSEERRRVVLLHELAHVKRRDCAVQALARCARALHWFNPLAYVAARQLRAEQERAADDAVLAAGTEASVYADHLFEIARAFRTAASLEGTTLAMARPSEIEGRLMAILDEYRNRGPLSRAARAWVGVAAAVVFVPLAALQVSAASAVQVSAPANTAAVDARPSSPLPTPERAAFAGARTTVRPRNGRQAAATVPHVTVDGNLDPDPNPRPDPNPQPSPNLGIELRQSGGSAAQAPAQAVDADTRKRVADALIMALDDTNQRVRAEALNTLASMHDERVIPGLVKALGDASPEVRQRAIAGLQQFDTPETGDALARALNDSSPDVRERAATALGNVRNRRAIGPLVQALKDANVNVRRRAAWALGVLRDPAAIDALTAALKDADPSVREQAAQSLGWIARGRQAPSLTGGQFNFDFSRATEFAAQFGERASQEAAKALEEQRQQLQRLRDQLDKLPALPELPQFNPAPVPPSNPTPR